MKRKALSLTLTLTLLVVFCTVLFSSCAKPITVGEVTIDRGNFNKKVDTEDLGFNVMSIDSSQATQSDQVAAVIYMMSVAEANYSNADSLARISIGGGSAETNFSGTIMSGAMSVRSLYIRDGNADKTYSQTIGVVSSGEPANLLSAVRALLDQGKRSYTTNSSLDTWESYKQEPGMGQKEDIVMSSDFPYAAMNFSKGDIKISNASTAAADLAEAQAYCTSDGRNWPTDWARGYLKQSGELTSFVIDEESLLASSCSVEYNEDDDYYTVNFELDLSTEEKQNYSTIYPRFSTRKSATSNDLEYVKYKVTLELWDNGLIKTWSTEESWEATLIIVKGIAEPSGVTSSTNTDVYSYDPDDCNIQSYIDEGVITIDWIDD